MSGEHHNDNDDDFLDDFVLDEGFGEQAEATPPPDRPEDEAGRFEELDEELNEELALDDPPRDDATEPPAAPVSFEPYDPTESSAPRAEPTDPDEEDVLFEDHTQGIEASVEFATKGQFDESNTNEWDGDQLDLAEDAEAGSEVGIPIDDDAGTPVELGVDADSLTSEEAFGNELDSLLQEPDEFVLESDSELELVDVEMEDEDDVVDGVSAVDGDAFVIADDGAEGGWQEIELAKSDSVVEYGQEIAAAAGGSEDGWEEIELAKVGPASGYDPVEGEDDAAGSEYFGNLSPAAGDGGETEEEGWEPLPGANMDELAEVDGVEAVGDDDDSAPEDYGEPALTAVGLHEDHDIYAEAEDEAEVIGGYRDRHRMLGVVTAAAAVLVMTFGSLIAVYRPEWFGLRFEPARVEIVHVSRPFVSVEVGQPPLPIAAAVTEGPPVAVTDPPVIEVGPGTENPPPVTGNGPGSDPVDPAPPTGTGNAGAGNPPVIENPDEPVVVPVPSPGAGDPGWPVAVANGAPIPTTDRGDAPPLMRVGSDLLVGQAAELPTRQTADGVMPGSRAFAQLDNGNYFIGNVKAVDSKFITLRLANGEISLARESIVRLTGLGSADYDELQKATSGFVRLTNNNRLIGSILETIADDHIILQTRSNRVMLPKADIGEIIRVDGSTDVRLGTTTEEDDWLRQMSERQLQGSDPRATAPRPDGSGRGN